jgi:hypothetical protein
VACVYGIYSICCHFFVRGDLRPFLWGIAIANLIYCCVTIGCVVLFNQALTILGRTYFISEIIIIIILVCIEILTIFKSNDLIFTESKP